MVILALLSIAAAGLGLNASAASWPISWRARCGDRECALELILSGVAVGVALMGWLLAHLFYRRSRRSREAGGRSSGRI